MSNDKKSKVFRTKVLAKQRVKVARPKGKVKQIIVDSDLGLVFKSEDEMLKHFAPLVSKFEAEYQAKNDTHEVDLNQISNLETILNDTLDAPDEVWKDDSSGVGSAPVFIFIRKLIDLKATHVVLAHVTQSDEPRFIYYQLISANPLVIEGYRKGDLVYDQILEQLEYAMIDGDALSEGDFMAVGLFKSMVTLRSDQDIANDKFISYGLKFREATIQEADEIWRSLDSSGNVLVTFIKECQGEGGAEFHYVVVTQQEADTGVHVLLFSFPTHDEHLLDRYRLGENLHAEEVEQESSH